VAVLSFKDRITAVAGSLGTASDNTLKQWVLDGCHDVLNKLKETANLMEFAIQSQAYSSPMSVDITDIQEIVHVQRDNIMCKPLRLSNLHLYENVDSLHFVTSDDPGFYILNNQLVVKPNPTSAQRAYYIYVPDYSITGFTGTSTIDNFPQKYYDHIVLYASYMALGSQLLDLLENDTDSSLSMNVISKMINNDKPDSGGDVWDWLVEEDSEMAAATLSAIQGASGVAKQKYDWFTAQMTEIRNLYLSKFPQPERPKGGR